MPRIFTSKRQKIGEIGENIAVKFLLKQNFIILDRNYTQKWGEIDIVAEKSNKLHFVEVKSVSRETLTDFTRLPAKASAPAGGTLDQYRPEENMHIWKLKRMSRVIQTYLLSKNIPAHKQWQVDLLVVFLDIKDKKSRIKVVSNIIL